MNPVKNQNNKAGLALAAAMVALTLYWAFTYSGPYRYLAELQLKQFGVYYSEATAIVIILGLLGVALGIKFLFRGAERLVPGTPSAAGNAAAPIATASEPWLRYFRYGALLVPFGFGGWTYYNGTHAGSLQQLTAVDFQNGKLQAHLVYADVRGHLRGRARTPEWDVSEQGALSVYPDVGGTKCSRAGAARGGSERKGNAEVHASRT